MNNNIDKPNRSTFIIYNSPIEFALVGPKGNSYGILIKSEKLQLDLIGFAASGESSFVKSVYTYNLFSSSRIISSVTSFPLKQIDDNLDKRKSEYMFYWVGLSSNSERDSIRRTFDRYIVDILSGIEQNDIEQIEWSIAPVILHCSRIHILSMRRQQWRLPIIILSIFLLLSILVTSFIKLYQSKQVEQPKQNSIMKDQTPLTNPKSSPKPSPNPHSTPPAKNKDI